MKIQVLDSKLIGEKRWSLCKGNLKDYLCTLRSDFFDYGIQRKIVKNSYLNNIYQSIIDNEPLPIITLVIKEIGEEGELLGEKFEILDGLQRTFRLWAVLHMYEISQEKQLKDGRELYRYLKETESESSLFYAEFVTLKFVKSLFVADGEKLMIEKIVDAYSQCDMYFYLWQNLSEQDVVNKMVVLNAGQKSVSSIHQYELLFLHFFDQDKLTYDKTKIHIYRERDAQFSDVKRGEKRKVGEYCLSSVIVALQSFIIGSPVRVSPTNQLADISDESVTETKQRYFDSEHLSTFIEQVYKIDLRLANIHEEYVSWFAKDTTLSGILGAIGAVVREDCEGEKEIIHIADRLVDVCQNFDLAEFWKAYNNLSSVSVNVGQAVRKAIFEYTLAKLRHEYIDWGKAFKED